MKQPAGTARKRALALFSLTILMMEPAMSLADSAALKPAGLAPDISVENWYWGPGNRWSYLHTRRIFPSADIYRGGGPVSVLEAAPRDIGAITFVNPVTKTTMTIAQMLAQTYTDAFLVMQDGKIVAEQYFNGMQPSDTHLLMSVTKSVMGALAGILAGEGRLKPDALITEYVPEVKGTAYDGATVRQLLDMSVGLDFNENYASKTSDLYRLDEAAGWVPRGPDAPRGLHQYFTTLKKRLGPDGQVFRYVSANVDLMGWVVERATGTDLATLLSTELWSKLGAERDAYMLLDGHQAAYSDAGLNTTLRDLGRFAQMMLEGGAYNGQRIVPEAWIEDIRHQGDPAAWKASPAYPYFSQLPGYVAGSYRAYWYVSGPGHEHFAAIGLAGQLILIDPASKTVIVKFSSDAKPESDNPQIDFVGAAAIIAALSERK